jgi:hypothetical protein
MTRRPLAACIALLATTACVGPSRTRHDYDLKAANTAEAVASAVGTAQVAVKAADAGRIPATYLSDVINDAADDASAVQATFDSVQPPGAASDQVRDELDQLVGAAVTTLVDLRTAVRRGEINQLAAIATPLAGIHDRLDAFEQAHS